MADKEATVYILDLGSSMADCHSGRVESDLDWSMRYVWDKICTTVAASRKTWNVGVIGVRTDESDLSVLGDNEDFQKEEYDNISVLRDLAPMGMKDLGQLRKRVRPSNTSTGDCISAVVVAMEMIEKVTKKLKYNRKIILVTDGTASFDTEIDDIAERITELGIQLVVLGVDFDDADFGYKEEDKTEFKSRNESVLRGLVDKCDGLFGTMAEAIDELGIPRTKHVRPYKTYDGPLTIGNPEEHPDAMSISVERYFKTHKAAIPPASRVVMKTGANGEASESVEADDGDAMQGVESTAPGFAAVKDARTYKVNDPFAPGGKRDVDRDDLARGYEYGSTAVHISESEFNITRIETKKSFSIVGFVREDKIEPFLNMGDACMTVAQKNNVAASLKLSSLIHSLQELDSYAVARMVAKDGKEPSLLLLAPHIEKDSECLYDVPLPFAEDVRDYRFPPLDKVITIMGKTITDNHRNLPSTDLQEAMDDYVDAMDISSWERDDDGNRTVEYAAVEDLFNPPIHRINQVVRHRAIHPDEPLPAIPPILLKYARPPEELVEKARTELEDLVERASVKKVPPRALSRKDKGARAKPISGLDIDALLAAPENKRETIDPNNAVPDFKRMMQNANDVSAAEDAVKQMGAIVRKLVTESFGDKEYDRSIEYLGVLRDTGIEYEFPALYNSFIADLKRRLLAGELGGDRRELWWLVKGAMLGLIDSEASEVSEVTKEEATEFYKK